MPGTPTVVHYPISIAFENLPWDYTCINTVLVSSTNNRVQCRCCSREHRRDQDWTDIFELHPCFSHHPIRHIQTTPAAEAQQSAGARRVQSDVLHTLLTFPPLRARSFTGSRLLLPSSGLRRWILFSLPIPIQEPCLSPRTTPSQDQLFSPNKRCNDKGRGGKFSCAGWQGHEQ